MHESQHRFAKHPDKLLWQVDVRVRPSTLNLKLQTQTLNTGEFD